MDDAAERAKDAYEAEASPAGGGFNPTLTVLVVVVGVVLLFVIANCTLYFYANKTLPSRKKKIMSKKKAKREKLKQGLTPAGE
ncbi:hypothetical protein CBR_g41122 [Chara braunii]|uniref:DNA-binding protein S1FA2 n=1 Tax=Chara braunii TaxID=69332 RepID=A0A388LV66_CHABU|nr:hypothetical protein CBR_g41122 [Chara braunii]|eukprot:GBG86217.1 hypothetical protein CBR_g41122 [Chara braunii]